MPLDHGAGASVSRLASAVVAVYIERTVCVCVRTIWSVLWCLVRSPITNTGRYHRAIILPFIRARDYEASAITEASGKSIEHIGAVTWL